MLNCNFLRPYFRLVLRPKSQWGVFLSAALLLFLIFHAPQRAESQTCSFDNYILASNNPFGACPVGTDTIIIRDSFLVDINYEPIIGGVPFEGLFLVDGGVIQWTANAYFKLGPAARVVLINGGIFRPASSNAPDCNSMRALYFDTKKTVDCNGSTAPHAFSDVNNAGCVTQQGICCNAFIVATDSSGNPNDLTLCQPGDTVQLAVLASGALNYSFFWSPDIGPGAGPYAATPTNNTNYSVNLTAIFDPYGIEPPYLLTCGGSVTVRINKPINVTATTTSVPCLDVPVGGISLTVIGGSPGYTYLWSTGATTKNLTNIPGGPYTVTITDSKGCIQIFSTTVPVLDNIPPTLTCPGNATGTASAGACTTLIPNINAVFSDNCPKVGVNYALSGATIGSGSGQLTNAVLFSSGITTATYTVNDGANTVSCNFTVTVNDTQLPTAGNPLPLSGIPCLAAVPAPDPNVVTTEADNCSVASVVHVSDVIASGSGCPGDTLVLLRSYRVSDVAGNSITVTQTIRVVDNVPPAFTSVPVNVLVNCQSIPTVGTPTASDNCGGSVNIAYNGETRTDGACPDTYIIKRRWTATDGCGNTATAEQILTVQDVTPPMFTTVPAAVTVSCDAIPTVGTPAATDNCDMGVTIVYNGQTRSDGACSDAYTLRRRWVATDNCGNTATAEQVIVVQDVAQPVFTVVPANVTVSCNAVPLVGTPAASDNCDTAVSILYNGETRTDGTCPDTYTLVRRWTATDNCGNTTSAIQTIFVQDATPPSFTTFPGNLTIGCDAIPAVGNPSAADNCSTNVTILYLGEMRNNGTCPDSYTLLRRWRATDACGNSTVATQTLTVRDMVAPVFNFIPANATISCDAVPPVGTPVAADNCAGLATINYDGQTRADGPCPDTYTLRRRWTAADNCGNTRTAEQILTVQDVTPPVFTSVPAAVTVNCEGIPTVGVPNASDNCDANVTITYNGETRINGSCSDNYTLVRRWTATDNCGNTTTAQQHLTVQDLTSPFFTFVPSNATVNCEEIPSMGMPLAADNCDNNVTITFAGVTQASGNCASGGTVTRRWIATDNCGNTAIAEQMLTVQDTTKPVFLLVPANVTVSCEAVPVPGVPEASDNCTSQVEINYNGAVRTNGPCPNTYSLLRRWTATDLCGNTALAEQTITVQDLTPPVFTFVPVNSIVSCNAVPVVGTPEATDNCDNGVAITYDGEIRTNGACPDTYTLQRKWTAADNCGNKVTATQVLVVQDITKPVFTAFPANATVSCENIPAVETPMASDNCTSNVIISFSGETREDGSCTNTFMLKRQWTIADNCGNTNSAVQVITVQDLTTPIFTFVPADVTVPCESVPIVGTPVASDNCTANVLVSFNGETRVDGPCTNSYILKRQWTAADVCGNTVSVAQFITVQDVKRPVFTFSPPDVTVDCENVPSVAAPTAVDNCAATVLIVYEGETRTNGTCPDTYTIIRRWTAADFCGNVESVNQVITVRDEGRPMFTFVPANVTVNCSDIPSVGTPTATDNCAAAVTISYVGETRVNGSCPDSYSLIRRWTATDNCGNTEQAQQIISVQDVLPPVFIFAPADATVSCDDIPAVGVPQATDNCTAAVAIVYQGETRTDGGCPGSYTLLRRWIATDNCGNTTLAEQLLTVQDVIPPIFTFIPANVTVDCQNIPVAGAPTAADNCTDAVTIAFVGETRTNGSCPDTYSLVRRWKATDNCGNSASAEQTITVQDVILPVFTFVPPNVTVECNAVPLLGQPTATDNCTVTVNISFLGEIRLDGTCPDSYMLERRWAATDNCGNATTALQTIAVRDVTPPVFSFVPPDATVNCEAVPAIGIPVISDNCDQNVSVTVTTELQTGSDCSTSGVLIRRWTAVDNCGNAAVAEQRLTVQDTTKPVFTLIPDDLIVNCSNVPAVGIPIATDNCTSTVSIVYDGEQRVDGSCPDTYILIRRWTATDVCGNIEMADQVITVQDLTAPVFTIVPNDVTISCESVPAVGTPVATDDCDTDVLIVYAGETRTNGACPETYELMRKWTAMDNCGNTISVTQSIVVQDLSAPVFTFVPASVTISCDAVPILGSPAATDNCDTDATITFNGEIRTNGSCPNTYTLTRRWTAVDNCGNTVSAEQVINVQDNTAPVFTFVPASATVNCEAVPSVAAPMASDNCTQNVAVVFEGETRTDGICPDTYTLTRRWRATDDCGNATTAEQLLTVQDISVPAFTFAPADTVVGCDAVPQPAFPTATDNCDPDVQIIYEGEAVISSTSSGTYNLQRRWTARDNCGNSAQITQLLVVRDTVAPGIVCPADIQVDADGAQCAAVVVFNAPVVSDNCTTSPVVVGSYASGAVFPVATTVVVFNATDDSGNTASCSFLIVVSDTTAPVLVNCPFDFTVTTPNGDCSTTVIWDDPLVTDACDGYPIVPQPNIQPFSVFPTGLTTVVYSAQDSTGNIMTCSFVVTVQEDIPPVLVNCPTDIVLYTDTCTAFATWIEPQATDNCESVTVVPNIPSGTVFPETTTTVVYTASDIWGNTTTCSFNVTVIDTISPQFSGCPADTVVSSGGTCSIAVDWQLPIATDNCTTDPLVYATPMPGDQYPVGYTNVQVIVEDPSGNKDVCVFKVTVIGPPLGFTDVPLDQSFVGCSAVAVWTPPAPTGVCAPAIVESNYLPGETFPVGITVVTYTVTDTLGYSATASFTISVTESIPPVFDCPASPVVVDISGAVVTDIGQFVSTASAVFTCDGVVLAFDLPLASDNCSVPFVEQTSGAVTGDFFALGDHLLKFKTTDDAGNTALCSVQVQVVPLNPLAPQVSDKIGCAGDDIVIFTPAIPGATYTWTGPKPPYPNSNNLLIENLSPALTGIYTVQALINGCLTPLDSALVRQAQLPNAVDDLDFEAETGGLLENFSVLLNDTYEDDDFTITVTGPLLGLVDLGNGNFTYQAGPSNGRVNFIYKLCSEACPDLCDEAVVTITVRETFCSYIPNIITPNDDGINDYLEIPCLNTDLYPNNTLIIYNQWGDKVYEASPYENTPDKAWRGTFKGRSGQNVPDGTYFYYFRPDPTKGALSGFLEIFR